MPVLGSREEKDWGSCLLHGPVLSHLGHIARLPAGVPGCGSPGSYHPTNKPDLSPEVVTCRPAVELPHPGLRAIF